MGKPKTQRTEQLRQAARRYTVAKQAEQAIEQHNLDRLVRAGVIVRDAVIWESEPGAAKEIASRFVSTEQSMLNIEGAGSGKAGPR